jgi:hypothetical protein
VKGQRSARAETCIDADPVILKDTISYGKQHLILVAPFKQKTSPE